MKEAIEQAADNYVKSMVAPSVSSEGMENIKTDFIAGAEWMQSQQQAEYQQLREENEKLKSDLLSAQHSLCKTVGLLTNILHHGDIDSYHDWITRVLNEVDEDLPDYNENGEPVLK